MPHLLPESMDESRPSDHAFMVKRKITLISQNSVFIRIIPIDFLIINDIYNESKPRYKFDITLFYGYDSNRRIKK